MSTDPNSVKQLHLDISKFSKCLQDKYSKLIGERMLSFIEWRFESLYGIDYPEFLKMLMKFLDQGPRYYKEMLFMCLSLSNRG